MISTFNYSDFLPLETTVALKNADSTTISVVLPAKNEENTIGAVISELRPLMKTPALIDEVVVMDSGSVDATSRIAKEYGATVYDIREIMPEITVSGKGVALWKSQFTTKSDIIIFIDADIREFSVRFIIGLAGALLAHKQLNFVKASYRRPLCHNDQKIQDAGGRVTELFMRPLLNLFLPELADVRQPLAGEYAVRRECITKIPFYSGFGVDIGLLLEHYFQWGVKSIGQVDVNERVHRNKNLLELSKMSFELGGVFFDLLQKKGFLQLDQKMGLKLKQWKSGKWSEHVLQNCILPPINGEKNV